MRGKKIRCENCGAWMPESSAKCPHCGAINESGAQQQYIHNLEKIKDDLEELPEELRRTYRMQVVRIWKRVLCIVAITVVIICVVAGVFRLVSRLWEKRYEPDVKAELLWEKEYFPQLDTWYAQEEYDAILEFMYSRYEDEGYCIWNWEHYSFISAYESYCFFMDTVDYMTNADVINKKTCMTMASSAMRFCFFLREEDYTQEEWQMIQELRSEVETVMYEDMKFTEAEVLELYEKINNDGYIDYEACDAYIGTIWERFGK